jgi:hypothetical protein
MKTRIYKRDLFAVILFYNEQLAMDHGAMAFSAAAQERIRRGFAELQKAKQKVERTNIWFVEYYVAFEPTGKYSVALVNEKDVLVIDFD